MNQPRLNAEERPPKKKKRTLIRELDLYSTAPGVYSPRSFLESGRSARRSERHLAALTVPEFKAHLTNELKSLELDEESQRSFLQAIGTPPQDDAFWQILNDIDQDSQLAKETDALFTLLNLKYRPQAGSWFQRLRQQLLTSQFIPWQELPEDSKFHQKQQNMPSFPDTCWDKIFCRSFEAKYGKPSPLQWPEAANKVLIQLSWLRQQALNQYQTRSRILQDLWKQGKETGLLTAVREGLMTEKWVSRAIVDLQWQQLEGETIGQQKQAAELLKQIGKALAGPGSGKTEILTPKEKKSIIADCLKWRPICEELNSAFKRLWKLPKYESSELCRKEARGSLAEKHGISIENVEAIEKVLRQPSRQANKSTPTTAMLEMVALAHMNRDVKTIEKIRQDYLDEHPAEKKKRKKPTTPTAEKTA